MARKKISIQQAFKILGLPNGASWDEIRAAYRSLAKQFHPDISSDPKAKDKFALVAIAYDRLEEWNNAGRPQQAHSSETFANLRARAAKEAAEKALKEAKRKEMIRRVRRLREKQDAEASRNYKKAIALVVTGLLLYFGVSEGRSWYNDSRIDENMGTSYITVTSQIPNYIKYVYVVNGKRYSDEARVHHGIDDNQAENGIPIYTQGRYLVEYAKDDPSYHRVIFNTPGPNTLKLYMDRGEDLLRWRFPRSFMGMSIEESKKAAHCLGLVLYEEYEAEYLANIFYSDKAFLENWSHNHGTFEDLMDDEQFAVCFSYCNLQFYHP